MDEKKKQDGRKEGKKEGKKGKEGYIWIAILLLSLFLASSSLPVNLSGTNERQEKERVQKSLADKVLRFHVVANSDAVVDQELKIKIKDEIVKELRNQLQQVKDKNEAVKSIGSQLGDLETMANNVIQREGYDYTSKASLGTSWFPVKMYGDMVFPQGEYEALKVEIGEAEGKNWWCVMFPTLCFVDETYQIVPEESKEQLREELTEDEYAELVTGDGIEVEGRFRFLDWIHSLRDDSVEQ